MPAAIVVVVTVLDDEIDVIEARCTAGISGLNVLYHMAALDLVNPTYNGRAEDNLMKLGIYVSRLTGNCESQNYMNGNYHVPAIMTIIM